jgi:TPR repeat protein
LKADSLGEKYAPYYLSIIYGSGEFGVGKDPDTALAWARKSAARGHEYSADIMRELFHKGLIASKNAEIADLRKRAETGEVEAQFQLGKILMEGNFLPDDHKESAVWYEKAAAQGDARAQNNLGFLYLMGLGVRQDYEKAVKWFGMAAEKNHPTAQNNLGWCYEWGLGVAANFRTASQWYSKAAEAGFSDAQFNLGCAYESGFVERDYAKAAEWYGKAVAQGHRRARFSLSFLYREGKGVEKDENKAEELLNKP